MNNTKYLKIIKSIKVLNNQNIKDNRLLLKKEKEIEIYYAPFDYVNSKAKIMIVGITPGFQQMTESYKSILEGKSLKQVKDLSSFKGAMRTTLVKYLDELKINKLFKITTCKSLFDKHSRFLHTTSLIKYPVFEKGKNYSGNNILKKKVLLDFIEEHFIKELKLLKNSIIIPLGNTVSSTIDYLNDKHKLKLKSFLKGFPHPSGLNVHKDVQFKKNKLAMLNVLR